MPSSTRRVVEHLVRDAPRGAVTPVQVARLATIGTVLVDGETADGLTGSTWLHAHPAPARYRHGPRHTTDDLT